MADELERWRRYSDLTVPELMAEVGRRVPKAPSQASAWHHWLARPAAVKAVYYLAVEEIAREVTDRIHKEMGGNDR